MKPDAPELPPDDFVYKLNQFEEAARQDRPAYHGYYSKRYAVMEHVDALRRRVLELEARVDELMLEYCPNEMTPEQISEWERNQTAMLTSAPPKESAR